MNIYKKYSAVWCAIFLSITSTTMYPMAATLVRGASFLITQQTNMVSSYKLAPFIAMAVTIAWSTYRERQIKQELVGIKREVMEANRKLDLMGDNVCSLQEQGKNVLIGQNRLESQVDEVLVSQRQLFTISTDTSDKVTSVNKITQEHTNVLMNIEQQVGRLEGTTTEVKETMATGQQVDSINQTIKDQLESFQKAIISMFGKVGINVNGSGLTLKRSHSLIRGK